MIRLNMNENPYPPPEKVLEAAKDSLNHLNRYSDPDDLETLRGLLAEYSDVSKDRIITGPGSNLIMREMIHIFSRGRKVIVLNPSFFPITECAREYVDKLVRIQLTPPEFKVDSDVIIDEAVEPALVIIDNPNNPTGKITLDSEMVEAILENRNTLLIVDEAYYEFSGVTFSDMVSDHPNLSILRTLDKAFSLAGARVGYLIGGDRFLEGLSTYDIFLPRTGLLCATEALRDPSYAKKNVQRVIDERERMFKELKRVGIEVFRSDANFLLLGTDIPDMAKELYERGVLISDPGSHWLPGYFRVTVGTTDENDIFLSKINGVIEDNRIRKK